MSIFSCYKKPFKYFCNTFRGVVKKPIFPRDRMLQGCQNLQEIFFYKINFLVNNI